MAQVYMMHVHYFAKLVRKEQPKETTTQTTRLPANPNAHPIWSQYHMSVFPTERVTYGLQF